MKVLVTSPWPDHHLGPLAAEFPQVEFVRATTLEDQKREITNADIIFGGIGSEAFRLNNQVRWVQSGSAGVDWMMAVPELIDSDVTVTNLRGAHASTISEHAIGMMVFLTHRFGPLFQAQQRKEWIRGIQPRQQGVSGWTMLIIGLGNIGRAIAKRAHAFEMTVLAADRDEVMQPEHVSELRRLDGLPDLIPRADVVVISTPLTRESMGMFGKAQFDLMKPGAYLIVVSRGKLIDETELIARLNDGRISGAGLDVQFREPMPADDPLWDAPNLLITPHSSGASEQTWTKGTAIFRENLRRFLARQELTNLIDKDLGY